MIRMMLNHRWLIAGVASFMALYAAFVYDAYREPPGKRCLRRADIPESLKALKSRYSPEPVENNGAFLYLEANEKCRVPDALIENAWLQPQRGRFFTLEQRQLLRTCVEMNAQSIETILAAQRKPFSRMPVHRYDRNMDEQDPNIHDTYLQKAHSMAEVLAIALLDASLMGDMARMELMGNALLRFHEMIVEGALMQDLYIARSISRIAVQSLEASLNITCPPAHVIQRWQELLGEEWYTSFKAVNEAHMNEIVYYTQDFSFTGIFFADDHPASIPVKMALEWTQFEFFFPHAVIYSTKVLMNAGQRDFYTSINLPVESLLKDLTNFRYWTIEMIGISLAQMYKSFAFHLARAAVARTALASLLYLDKHEKMLDRLEALTPGYLPLPEYDPFTRAELLRYRVNDGHAVFYSVGPNKKDDGGTEAEVNQSVCEHGDIIFRLPLLEADSNL